MMSLPEEATGTANHVGKKVPVIIRPDGKKTELTPAILHDPSKAIQAIRRWYEEWRFNEQLEESQDQERDLLEHD